MFFVARLVGEMAFIFTKPDFVIVNWRTVRIGLILSVCVDPSALHDVVQHADAVRVVFVECNSSECAMSEAMKVGNEWQVQSGLESSPADTHVKKVLMMSMADTE